MTMKTFLTFLLVAMFCNFYRALEHSKNSVENGEDVTEKDDENDLDLSIIWYELRNLRDMVLEQRAELNQLTAQITATDILVEALQKDNTALEARMTAAETLAEELLMEKDAQAAELAAAKQTLSAIQERLTVNKYQVEDLQKQQEGQKVALQELQNTNSARKVAFSTSLLADSEGNTSTQDFIQLIYRNVFTNTGNHYSPITGYFTAPVRGVYYFRFTAHIAFCKDGMRMRLVKNGQPMVFIGDRPTQSTDTEDSGSNGVVLQLEAGDVVSIQFDGEVWDDQYHRTTFSGFLLFNC
ncbi:uncharacterized protein [Leuresthes tenuis]|uniref:uncharacterized protein n=1 Tax=Leuresthes tenuis TaxID=355514 RepID=UPI003B505FA2